MLLLALLSLSASAGGHARRDLPVVAEYSAHTLRFGEIQVGSAGLYAGVAPRVQLGTRLLIDTVGLPNVSLRVHAYDGDALDVTLHGTALSSALEGLDALAVSAGATVSASRGRFSGHLGSRLHRIDLQGIPSGAPDWVRAVVGSDPVASAATELNELGVSPVFDATAATVRGAAEVRLIPRGGLLFQGATTMWARSAAQLSAPNDDVRFDATTQIADMLDNYASPGGAWVATVSWQQSLGPMTVRAGAGGSGVPLAWIGQAMAASLRFGGFKKTPDASGD